MKCSNKDCKDDAIGWRDLKGGGGSQVNECDKHVSDQVKAQLADSPAPKAANGKK